MRDTMGRGIPIGDSGLPASAHTTIPLAVDLDGTVLTGNSLYECAVALIRSNPLYLFAVPFWLLQGQGTLWLKIMDRIRPDPEWLPYRSELLAWLRSEHKSRTLVLVTGADQRLAQAVADHLGVFSSAIGTADGVHLTGARKRAALIARYGERGFDYVGDSSVDIPVWSAARKAYCVAPSDGLRSQILRMTPAVECIDAKGPAGAFPLTRLLRVHQWAKNVLVFAPVITSHKVFSPGVRGTRLGIRRLLLLRLYKPNPERCDGSGVTDPAASTNTAGRLRPAVSPLRLPSPRQCSLSLGL